MPGPTTEILNDDLKELKGELKEFKAEIHRDFGILREDVQRVAVELAGLKGEFKVISDVAKYAGAVLVTTVLTSGIAGIWWASGVNAKFASLEIRMDDRFKANDLRMDDKFKAIDDRLDRLETLITKVVDQGRSAPPAAKAENSALKK